MKSHLSIVVILGLFLLLAVGIGIGLAAGDQTQAESSAKVWVTDYISNSPPAGGHTSIAFDGNTPWVAYRHDTRGSLMVAHYVGAGNGNCNPNDAWKCEEVDYTSGESKGLYTSIAAHPDTNPDPFISNWRIGVSYYDATHRSLKYARYTCPFIGDCQWTISTVDSSADVDDIVGQYTSLKFGTEGTPHISYYMYNDLTDPFKKEMVKYAFYIGGGAGDCGDGNDWVCQVIEDAFGSVGKYTSLDLDWENRVYISYYDGVNGALKLARYVGFGGDCGNAGDWQCDFIDERASEDVGMFSSIHASKNPDDYMRIAYYNQTAGTLMYAYDTVGTGNCGENGGWQCDMIEEIGAGLPQVGISLAMDEDNNPMIAYTDGHEDLAPLGLKVAQPAPFTSYANCGGELIYDWWCQSIDNGGAYQEEAEFLGLGIKPNGLAVIAYSELDTYAYPAEYNLKIAYQLVNGFLPLLIK